VTVSLTKFESDMMRLQHVYIRFMTIYKEYPNQMIDDPHHKLVRYIFREFIVEQLHNFVKIRKDLLRNPDFVKLDKIMYPLVKQILDHQIPIKLLRDNYISHVQDTDRKFKLMTQEICEKYNLPTAWGYWRFLAGCAFFYSGIINLNFKKEFDKAQKKYDAMTGLPLTIPSEYKMANTQQKISKILNPLCLELDKLGYNTSYSKEQIEKLKQSKSKK